MLIYFTSQEPIPLDRTNVLCYSESGEVTGKVKMLKNNAYPKYPGMINLAAFHPGTHALGPGLRAVVWVQGCPFSCKGCIAPGWIPFRNTNLVDPLQLSRQILSIPDLSGITISGGEPMMQAGPLSRLVNAIHAEKDLTIIVFSGFTLEKLQSDPPNPEVSQLLPSIDVLIDGLYVEKHNDGKGLRGSSNQRFHYLTERLKDFDFTLIPRNVEINFKGNESFLIGIPTPESYSAYNKAFDNTLLKNGKVEGSHERS